MSVRKVSSFFLLFHGLSLIISGCIYAFSPTFTPWHSMAIGNNIVADGTQRVLFSLYRVVGWTVIVCGLSVILLSHGMFISSRKGLYFIENNMILWLILFLLALTPTTSSLIVSFQVGWRFCPWYMPALGILICLPSLYILKPSKNEKKTKFK